MIGLEQGRVVLAPYDASWPELYEAQRARIVAAIGEMAAGIEHVGSTAVAGMPSKPILDVAVRLRRVEDVKGAVEALTDCGYGYRGEYGLPGRHFFVRGNPPTVHLHVAEPGTPHWERWLAFRDRLRSDRELASAYAGLKRELASRFAGDRDAYTKAKTPFIEAALRGKGYLNSGASPAH